MASQTEEIILKLVNIATELLHEEKVAEADRDAALSHVKDLEVSDDTKQKVQAFFDQVAAATTPTPAPTPAPTPDPANGTTPAPTIPAPTA